MLDKIIKILDKAVVNNVKVYDTTSFTPYFDNVIICSVNNSRQGNAAVNYLKNDVSELGLKVRSFNTGVDTKWFLVDLNNTIIHIFVGEERERYNLDGLYSNLIKEQK